MNKLLDTISSPKRQRAIQRIANLQPSWTSPRQDIYSNYQSILGDITTPLFSTRESISQSIEELFVGNKSFDDPGFVYCYIDNENLPVFVTESTRAFMAPLSVTASNEDIEYTLWKADTVEELAKKHETVKANLAGTELPIKSDAYKYINASYGPGEVKIFVKERCILGLEKFVSEEFEPSPEDFYVKEKSVYHFGTIELFDINNNLIQVSRLSSLPVSEFPYYVNPGIYIVKINPFDSSYLNDYTINLVANRTYSLLCKIAGAEPYLDGNLDAARVGMETYLRVKNNKLETFVYDATGNSSTQVVESTMLLNENNETYEIQTWTIREGFLCTLSEEGNKLYLYDLLPESSKFLYLDSHQYTAEIVVDTQQPEVEETIYIETRQGYSLNEYQIESYRLKVESYEDDTSYYIDEDGNTVEDYEAWRSFNGLALKWSWQVPTIGSFRFTLESLDINRDISIASTKIINVPYKVPAVLLSLSEELFGSLGVTPNKELIIREEETVTYLPMVKMGYWFDSVTGYIWTTYPFDELIVTYPN
jgi:hypothetical protein